MHQYVTGSAERSQCCCRISQEKKKPARGGQHNTGSNVSNVVPFSGRATGEAQVNNNHSYYHL